MGSDTPAALVISRSVGEATPRSAKRRVAAAMRSARMVSRDFFTSCVIGEFALALRFVQGCVQFLETQPMQALTKMPGCPRCKDIAASCTVQKHPSQHRRHGAVLGESPDTVI